MNNGWVGSSLLTNKLLVWDGSKGERWLDRLGLFETSWLIFAGTGRYKNNDFGYPGEDNNEQ